MERFQELRLLSEEKVKAADHLLTTTYPVVKEPKLLISILQTIFQAFEYAITSLLEYERKNSHTILTYAEDFENRLEIFKRKIATKYKLDARIIEFVISMKDTLDKHKQTQVEFTRKHKFVITDTEYNLTTLTAEGLKKTLSESRTYLARLFSIIDDDNNKR